jgi:hypothetical protein
MKIHHLDKCLLQVDGLKYNDYILVVNNSEKRYLMILGSQLILNEKGEVLFWCNENGIASQVRNLYIQQAQSKLLIIKTASMCLTFSGW